MPFQGGEYQHTRTCSVLYVIVPRFDGVATRERYSSMKREQDDQAKKISIREFKQDAVQMAQVVLLYAQAFNLTHEQ